MSAQSVKRNLGICLENGELRLETSSKKYYRLGAPSSFSVTSSNRNQYTITLFDLDVHCDKSLMHFSISGLTAKKVGSWVFCLFEFTNATLRFDGTISKLANREVVVFNPVSDEERAIFFQFYAPLFNEADQEEEGSQIEIVLDPWNKSLLNRVAPSSFLGQNPLPFFGLRMVNESRSEALLGKGREGDQRNPYRPFLQAIPRIMEIYLAHFPSQKALLPPVQKYYDAIKQAKVPSHLETHIFVEMVRSLFVRGKELNQSAYLSCFQACSQLLPSQYKEIPLERVFGDPLQVLD